MRQTERKPSKEQLEKSILLALIDQYIATGQPIGSETLRDAHFPDISSATVRNYFAALEEQGLLQQQHASGGRTPTPRALRLFAAEALDAKVTSSKLPPLPDLPADMREVVLFLQRMAEAVSEQSGCACFLAAPRFDQDFVTQCRLLGLDHGRCLAVLVTHFGLVHTELLHAPQKLSAHMLQHIEAYFHARLIGSEMPLELTPEEQELALRFYQEAMARYLVTSTMLSEEDLFRAGLSKLLRYPEYQEAASLTSSLSLFENRTALHALVRDVLRAGRTKFWIGEDLMNFVPAIPNCAVLVAPYRIGGRPAGALGIVGPMRMPYGQQFALLANATEAISTYLTSHLAQHKITFRAPTAHVLELPYQEHALLAHHNPKSI